ncbi:MAG: hypothetical protein WCW02_02355, partial [Candidatus Buchananbacteria bacterium]
QIVSGSEDSTIKIWKPDAKGNYQEPKTLEGHTDWVRTLQILPDGQIVSGSNDDTIKIWDGDKVE